MADMDFRVEIHKNESSSDGKVLVVRKGMNMSKFKKAAGRKLGIKAKKVFLQSGAEITLVDEMQNNDTFVLFI